MDMDYNCINDQRRIIIASLLAFSVLALSGCATAPPSTLEYKSFENPKGGVLFLNPMPYDGKRYEESDAMYLKRKTEYENAQKAPMREFCAPEPYRIIAEGYLTNSTGSSSTQIGQFTITNIKSGRQLFQKFECGAARVPTGAK